MLRNLIVKTQCDTDVAHWQLRASAVVSVSSKTQLAQLIQSSLQQPLEHDTVVVVFLYVRLIISHFLLTLNSPRMSVLNSTYDSFIGIMGFRTVKF